MTNLEQWIELRNTDRLQRTIQKLKNKEPVSLCFLGGSITSGFKNEPELCFVELFKQWLLKTYPDCNLSIHNLAIAGTPSIFGLYQCLQYVGQYEPDLIFIEYAINDMKNAEYQSAFESLVYKSLSFEKEPGVILLLARSNVHYTCQNFMDMVGEHYHQTSVFISKLIDSVAWEDYSDDYGHPNRSGNQFICDLLSTLFVMAEKAPLICNALPDKAFYENSLSGLVFENKICNYSGTKQQTLFEIKVKCRFLYLLYFVSPEDTWGDAELIIDGEKYEVLSAYRINSWEHLLGHIISLGEKKELHTICIKMQKGEEDKLFSLQNVGYC